MHGITDGLHVYCLCWCCKLLMQSDRVVHPQAHAELAERLNSQQMMAAQQAERAQAQLHSMQVLRPCLSYAWSPMMTAFILAGYTPAHLDSQLACSQT